MEPTLIMDRNPEATDRGTPTLVNPASTLLQDMLKEHRAHRDSRGSTEDWDNNAPRTPERSRTQEDNASTASEKTRKVSDTFSAGLRNPKEMGMREMDQVGPSVEPWEHKLINCEQYVSKMNKLNFDLKLEVFHRTQQMANLENKLERMKSMEEELSRMHKLEEEVEELREADRDNCRLRESNEELRQELDKRTQAVTEAVQLICQLEAKIEQLEFGGQTLQASPSRLVLNNPDSSTPKAEAQATVEIPERTSSRGGTLKHRLARPKSSDLRQLPKAPLFLRDENQSTAALRSLYVQENNGSHLALSEMTKSESFHTMNDTTEPGSPRLSVLSEASELNPVDTPSKWQDFDKLDIPVRKALSTTSSMTSSLTPSKLVENKDDHVDSWMQSQTIVQRRQNRAMSDASKTAVPTFGDDLFTSKPRGRPRLDTSLFEGARLPPTPDTMSTAYAAVNNGSNGSIAPKSPQQNRDQLFSGPRLERHRSADELTTRRSRAGSDVTDSMQTNCSDTPRLGGRKSESPVMYPFNTVASKASELLGPGSPNNPALESFADFFHRDSMEEAVPPPITRRTPTKPRDLQQKSTEPDSSPPLTPQDWLAAAKQAPQPRKERARGLRIEQQQDGPARNIISNAAFHDNDSTDSLPVEPEVPGIPTLNMEALEILEDPAPEHLASIPEPEDEPDLEPRRRFSFRPAFLSRSHGPRRLQPSPTMPDFADDEDGAPSPIIPKTRNQGNAPRRPMSQIITNSAGMYSNIPTGDNFEDRVFHQFLMEREANLPTEPATISGRPSTSHSTEHKRRSSLGIFGWMKNVGGKRQEPATPMVTEAQKENRNPARFTKDPPQFSVSRPSTPDSMDAPVVRPRSMMTVESDDTARRPRYMGRRSRRT